MYDDDNQDKLNDKSLVFKPTKNKQNNFDMNNPNPWYSNPQIWPNSIRWHDNRGESAIAPEWAKLWTTYYDNQKGIERKYTAQQWDWTGINGWATGYDYVVGNYVMYNNNLYECIKAHTSWIITPTSVTYRAKEWWMIHRWTPEYWPTYSFASLASPLSLWAGLTKIVFDTYSTNDGYTSSTAGSEKIPADWIYLIVCLAKFDDSSSIKELLLYKNWASVISIKQDNDVELTWLLKCDKDDILDMYVDTTGSMTVSPYFKIYKLWW